LLAGVEAMQAADREVAVGLLIETVEGVENVDAIAAVAGVDYLFIGTGDLSLSRGTSDADVIRRDCERVLRAARTHGLPCGIFTGDVGSARRAIAGGYQMAVCANDIELVKQGFLAAREQLRR
jgi:2-dehydro-3-deoxyglucarate aldolase/4-hydroxy-2-oxoheptanedioate aldolase